MQRAEKQARDGRQFLGCLVEVTVGQPGSEDCKGQKERVVCLALPGQHKHGQRAAEEILLGRHILDCFCGCWCSACILCRGAF